MVRSFLEPEPGSVPHSSEMGAGGQEYKRNRAGCAARKRDFLRPDARAPGRPAATRGAAGNAGARFLLVRRHSKARENAERTRARSEILEKAEIGHDRDARPRRRAGVAGPADDGAARRA